MRRFGLASDITFVWFYISGSLLNFMVSMTCGIKSFHRFQEDYPTSTNYKAGCAANGQTKRASENDTG